MREISRSLESAHFAEFQCLGADCEDTCCDGWAVAIDRPVYEKYQQCSDPDWRDSFQKLITINSSPSDHDYARIRLSSSTCPFLSEGLCSIHKQLGEAYLSVTCASFPRVWNTVDDVLEKSLDLACPEAVRRVLLDPTPMAFHEIALNGQDFSTARIASIDTSCEGGLAKPYLHFQAVRGFVVGLLQTRELALWKRILILGYFCDKVQELGATPSRIPDLIGAYREAVSSGAFEDVLRQLPEQPSVRIETVLELIVARITSDFTNHRFLSCYKEFMDGISWGPESSMDEICARYQEAYSRYAAPFLNRHEYMLEHYLVNYVYRTLFPFGPQQSTYELRNQNMERSIHGEFTLLATNFAIIHTMLAGMAGFHKEAFGAAQVIQVIYTFTRTFEHSLTFAQRVMQALEEKGLNNPEGVAVLVKCRNTP